jgi:hypothetical protein
MRPHINQQFGAATAARRPAITKPLLDRPAVGEVYGLAPGSSTRRVPSMD